MRNKLKRITIGLTLIIISGFIGHERGYKKGHEESFNKLTNMMIDEKQWEELIDLVNKKNGAFDKYWKNKENER